MSCPTTVMSCPQLPADPGPSRLKGRLPCRASARSSLVARAGHLIRHSWRAYWDWRARQATILLLRSLDGRALRDIGITPSEIESFVNGGGQHCRRYDPTWTHRR